MDTCPFMVPLIPLFWTSGDVFSGFQNQWSALFTHGKVACDEHLMCHLLTFLMASMAAGRCFPQKAFLGRTQDPFFVKFWRTSVLFLIPLFWTSGNVFPGFQSQGSLSLACFLTYLQWLSWIHLMCKTYWPLDGQHGSYVSLVHVGWICVSKQLISKNVLLGGTKIYITSYQDLCTVSLVFLDSLR